jgi:ubiquinone/menaquinone biosynthesis C-methylase UbiE
MKSDDSLTERQQREIEYHKDHAALNKDLVQKDFDYDLIFNKKRRWWNQYWSMYTYLLSKDLKNKNVLVVGCGFGEDAFYLSKAGANVKAFDLSPESIAIAKERASRENLNIQFDIMPAEKLSYEDNIFDLIVARDILHHVNIPDSISEIYRVSKPKAIFFFNEVYSHSFTDKIRYSNFVNKWLYPKMTNFVYKGQKPYITEDERKLTENDVNQFLSLMQHIEIKKYYNFIVTRIFPETYIIFSKIDRILLILLSPVAHLLASRVLVGGVINKSAPK